MKKFISEFKEFAMRGSVIDLAVGVIIGGAFKAIVDSFVNDIISPVIGVLTGKNFSENYLYLGGAQLNYGAFITAVLNFLIIAFVLFTIVKSANRVRSLKKKAETAPTTKKCPYCKSEIALDATRCPHCTSVLDK